MKEYSRLVRVNEQIKREIGLSIEREIAGEIEGLVTVTRVETAPDLRTARVMISFLGGDPQRERLQELLERHRPDLQDAISRNTNLKYTPVLSFRMDRIAERADHVFHLLNELGLNDAETDEPADE